MFDAEIDAHIVIALALEIILEIALTLNEKIVIDGALLEDRNVFFELSSRDFRFDGFYFDDRPGIDIQARRDPASPGVVIETGEFHFGGKPALALIFVLQPLNAAAGARVGYLPPPVNDGDAPFCRADNDGVREQLVAVDDRSCVFRALSFADLKSDEYLLAFL